MTIGWPPVTPTGFGGVSTGMDTSKSVFQLHGVDENELVVVRGQFPQAEMIRSVERLPPVLVTIESCDCSRH